MRNWSKQSFQANKKISNSYEIDNNSKKLYMKKFPSSMHKMSKNSIDKV